MEEDKLWSMFFCQPNCHLLYLRLLFMSRDYVVPLELNLRMPCIHSSLYAFCCLCSLCCWRGHPWRWHIDVMLVCANVYASAI
jgi:hypothetical protein